MGNVCNVEKFEEWLKRRLSDNNFEVKKYVNELINQYAATDLTQYELSKNETISGTPEYYEYKVEFNKIDDDNFETKFIL